MTPVHAEAGKNLKTVTAQNNLKLMKNICFLTAMILASGLIRADLPTYRNFQQDKSPKDYKKYTGFFFSPDYAYRVLTSKDSISKITAALKNDREKAVLGFTTGVIYNRKLFGTFYVESGLNYMRKGESSQIDSLTLQDPKRWMEINTYNFLQVPIRLRINFPSGRTNTFVNAGVTGQFLINAVKETTQTFINNGASSTTRQAVKADIYNRFLTGVYLGIGFEYRMISRLFVRVEPNYQTTISSLTKTNIGTALYSAGINLGLLWGLK